jgi:hypothetical protein
MSCLKQQTLTLGALGVFLLVAVTAGVWLVIHTPAKQAVISHATAKEETVRPPEESKPTPPTIQAENAVRIFAELPERPVWMRAPIPLKVRVDNISDQEVMICGPLIGNMDFDRDPNYTVRIFDSQGREVPFQKDFGLCGYLGMSPPYPKDFQRLKPGESTRFEIPTGPWPWRYSGLQAGSPYTLTVAYRMTGAGDDSRFYDEQVGVVQLRIQAIRGQVTSPPVKVSFSAIPVTDEDKKNDAERTPRRGKWI